MNNTQKGVLIAIVVALLGGVAWMTLKPNTDALKDAAKQVADKAAETAKQAGGLVDLGTTLDKTSRLIADAGSATTEMKALFADGKVPDATALSAARTKIETALKGVTAIEIPAGAEGAAADMLKKARDNAQAALDALGKLPADSAGALAALGSIESLLTGKPAAAAPAAPAATSADANAAAPAASTGSETAAAPAAKATADTANADPFKPGVPVFDLLRVEPDGSTVIAGRASEGDKIEVLDGSAVVSSTMAAAGGDFAAILDNPLSAGDHQLTLRVTNKDGKQILSEEVATVSVPKDGKGELLAMVSRPGEASRVITAPGAPKDAAATAEAPASAPDASASASATATGAAAASGETAAAPAAPGVKAALQISAVELEGDRMFIAGTADPKAKVMAYADDKLVGEDVAGDDGHFVVDGTLPLSVGQHKIRVDQADASGKIAFRAEVPFDRPEGEQVAAVATQDAANATMQPLGDGAFDQHRAEAAKAFALLKGLFADGKVPSAEELAAARSATEIALQSLIGFALPDNADQAARDMVAKTRESASAALAKLKALPASTADASVALGEIGKLIDATLAPAGAANAEDASATSKAAKPAATANEPAADANASASASGSASSSASAASAEEPAKVEQAPLTGSDSSVIIRKGDTLWQISRRVYGRGVRYTTIYLANKDQIKNPDRILPGQVFGVPGKALPNAEELHRQRLQGENVQ